MSKPLEGLMDEDAMLARLEASWGAASAYRAPRPVCRVHAGRE